MDINLTAPINNLGYGLVSLNILAALHKAGNKPALWIIGPDEHPASHDAIVTEARQRTQTYHKNAPSFRIWHQFELAQHVGKGLHCALPIFELDRFRPVELHHLKQQDLVIVPSSWAARILDDNGIPNAQVAPFGVDNEIFYPRDEPAKSDNIGPTTFINIGKWELRKGHDVLVEAFNKAFTPTDNVRLIMHCYNPCFPDQESLERYNTQWVNLYRRSKLAGKIDISTGRLPTQQDVANLMATADCGVFPARAEGWNMELAEMLAMGKTCIATHFSAHTEFINRECCHLIDIDQVEDAFDGVWFLGQGQWAALGAPQMAQLVQHMRDVHDMKQSGCCMRNQEAIDHMEAFTWKNTARDIQFAINSRS